VCAFQNLSQSVFELVFRRVFSLISCDFGCQQLTASKDLPPKASCCESSGTLQYTYLPY